MRYAWCSHALITLLLVWTPAILAATQYTSRKQLVLPAIIRADDADCAPLEVHLALADDAQSMRLMWRTTSSGCPTTADYGRISSDVNEALQQRLSAEGTSYDVTENLMCSAPAKEKKFRVIMHSLLLTDLEYGTAYWYRIAGSDTSFTFKSPLSPGSGSHFSFIGFGDMGQSMIKPKKCPMAATTVQTMADEMWQRPVDLILHMGDLAYADGSYKMWDSFMRLVQPLASQVPYMVGVGNHEYDYKSGTENDPSGCKPYHPEWGNYGDESGGECGAMIVGRFSMPGAGPLSMRLKNGKTVNSYSNSQGSSSTSSGMQQIIDRSSSSSSSMSDGSSTNAIVSKPSSAEPNAPFWYSFNYGSVHFTLISTEHDIMPGSRQYHWLQADLANVDRCATPWMVVGMHRPMYVVFPHKDNRIVGDHLRQEIEDLLIEHKVDLTISGHVHSYYRTCDVEHNRCTKDGSGITHIVVGSAGHKLSNVEDDQKEWCEAALQEYGFCRFDVRGDEMDMSFILSKSGEVADRVTLKAQVFTPAECAGANRKKQ